MKNQLFPNIPVRQNQPQVGHMYALGNEQFSLVVCLFGTFKTPLLITSQGEFRIAAGPLGPPVAFHSLDYTYVDKESTEADFKRGRFAAEFELVASLTKNPVLA